MHSIIDSKGNEKIIVYKYDSETQSNYGMRLVYNEPVDSVFIDIIKEQNLKYIEFCPSFNQSIDNLPDCIETIIFSVNSEFNQPLDNLPSRLKHLELYDEFNQPLDYLPVGLKTLLINAYFNHPLNNLPSTLEHLQIKGEFNYPLDNLPLGLKKLEIMDIYDNNDYYSKIIVRNYDKNITKFSYPLNYLPDGLEYLDISAKIYNHKITKLPISMKKLIMHKNYCIDIESLENLKNKFPNVEISIL